MKLKLKQIALYQDGRVEAAFVYEHGTNMAIWHDVPASLPLPEWAKQRFAVLMIAPRGQSSITFVDDVGEIHHWAHGSDHYSYYRIGVPDEHADMWSELPHIQLKEKSYANT